MALCAGFAILSKSYCAILCDGLSESSAFRVSLTFDIAAFLFLFPFVTGYISLCAKNACGYGADLSELLSFYSAKKIIPCYAFLLKLIPHFILRAVFPFIALGMAYTYLPVGLEYLGKNGFNNLADIISANFFIFEIAAAVIAFLLSGALILRTICFVLNKEYVYSFREKSRFNSLRISFIPLCLLSVFTFGILFPAYTLPVMTISYSRFAAGNENSAGAPENTDSAVFGDADGNVRTEL